MIATILPSSTTFHAVDYRSSSARLLPKGRKNERKVSEGVAELLEMKNFDFIGLLQSYTPEQLKQFLTDYSQRNAYIRSPQFHLAISCRGDEYTHEQLLDIAHQYLKEMGYGEDGQPILIYAHHDTDNNHLHIVTSRVAPNSHKINDHHERVRSQEVISRIMGESQKQRAFDSIKKALEYHFSTVKQFQAVLESMGYQCYERDNQLCIKRDGCVIERLNLSDISSKCQNATIDEKRQRQLRAILLKYRDMSADKEELKATMKQKFGIDIIFHGSKDKPYGYTIIDHQSKTVLKGSEVLKLKELLQFHSKQERLHRMDEFIDAILDDNPDLTTRELNKMLRRQFGTHISKGRIAYNDDFIDLQDYQTETLRANDRKAWLKAHPLEAANHQQQTTKESNTIHIQEPSITKEGSRDQNREWEVGRKSNYDEVDDERQLKR